MRSHADPQQRIDRLRRAALEPPDAETWAAADDDSAPEPPPHPPPRTVPRAAAALAAVVALLALVVAIPRFLTSDPEVEPVPPRTPASATSSIAPVAVASATPSVVLVHVAGQVRHPGLVRLTPGARVADALTEAGGATKHADLAAVNLARQVADGEQVFVPKPGDAPPAGEPAAAPGATTSRGPIDLNTADEAALDALPGVGPVIAGRIVAWRQEHGKFSSVDELAEVSGIGEATLTRLRPLVRT